jgi:hypothetical protein
VAIYALCRDQQHEDESNARILTEDDRSDISLCSRLAQQSRVTSQSVSFEIANGNHCKALNSRDFSS